MAESLSNEFLPESHPCILWSYKNLEKKKHATIFIIVKKTPLNANG